MSNHHDVDLTQFLEVHYQYRMQLIDLSINTIAILVVERKPPEIWERICSSAKVVLVWPGKFKKCFEHF